MGHIITVISSHQIDFARWDTCIRNSANPIIYGNSFYLNHMAEQWSGVVVNDYEAVMPLPWKKKYGIRYSYQVPFIQQLGWFAVQHFPAQQAMLQVLNQFCRYGDYSFNYGNPVAPPVKVHNNYLLDLSKSYADIQAGYKTDMMNNLKKARKERLVYGEEAVETAFLVFKKMYASRTAHVTDTDFNNFLRLCNFLVNQGQAFARKITNPQNELLAAALLLKDENRIYNMMNSITEAGRKTEANHLLFDEIFSEFAGTGLFFDFEGSDIPGIQKFYEKSGAVNQQYASLHFNHLPFPVRLLKR